MMLPCSLLQNIRRFISRQTYDLTKNEPVALKTKLSWVLMGGRSASINISASKISVDNNIRKIVENFRNVESLGTHEYKQRSLLSEDENTALNRLE